MDLQLVLDTFWKYDVWKVNTDNIYNDKLKTIIKRVNNLQQKLDKHRPSFNIINNEVYINDSSDIINQINKLKKNNMVYIKTHAECIPEYHMCVINFKLKYQNVLINDI